MTEIPDYTNFLSSTVYADSIYRNQHLLEIGITLIKMCYSLRLHFINSCLQEGHV